MDSSRLEERLCELAGQVLALAEENRQLAARVDELEKKPDTWLGRYSEAIGRLRIAKETHDQAVLGKEGQKRILETATGVSTAYEQCDVVWSDAAADYLFMRRQTARLHPESIRDHLTDELKQEVVDNIFAYFDGEPTFEFAELLRRLIRVVIDRDFTEDDDGRRGNEDRKRAAG